MSLDRRLATPALTTLLVVLIGLVTGCARIPTDGAVRDGTTELEQASEIGFIPAGPTPGASPDAIVQGFLTNAQAGPTSAASFAAAQEYLTPAAWRAWDRYVRVLVLDGDPQLVPEDLEEGATSTTVTGSAVVVATVDERGVYTEETDPSTVPVTFALTKRADGEWRISQLENGLMITTGFFSQAFHLTRLYFPTPDLAWWVPDVRWFPRQTWRTDATSEILAGPPEWLADSTTTVIPEGTSLAIDAVTVTDDGTIDVSLTSTITQATADQRALAVAQLEATLVEGEGRDVELSDGTSPLPVPDNAVISTPQTRGDALAVSDGALYRVVGQSLVDLEDAPSLDGLDPTALATGPGDRPIVVRDGSDRILRLSGTGVPDVVMTGRDLVPPSVDRFESVWSARGNTLLVGLASGGVQTLDVDWLDTRTVRSVRVSPEGARVAIVSSGPSGRLVHVAGIQRDADSVPTGLSTPVQVGASVDQVDVAVWQEDTVLALIGAEQDGDRAVFVAGVGGQAGTGGLARVLTGVTEPTWVTASVGSGAMLVLDGDDTLHARQTSSLWPPVAEGVDLVAYPG
ncbi:LpqB family beta-propeller domain-containing protein [Isoptericola hypogeus]|uniref:LpqB family beta-propeller domain-containing protein n=1 Tax=Isoptericola hypogeus TaxID=300179 RepID=A0ABN2IQQ8_9MICO